jgi:pimeloyl-ACP methyl ester carboxylesterase
MDGLAQIVDTVVRHLKLNTFIGLGVGVGANVLLRYAVKNQNVLTALILINADCGTAGWLEWGYQKMNINLLRSKGMNNFTVNYLIWHNFGKHEDQCDQDVLHQYRSFFFNHPNPNNLAMLMESYLK